MIRVIVVDDERNIREGIMHLVDWAGSGCEVVANCANGNIALQYLQNNPVDIVVTDIKMPIMDGLELSRIISEQFKQIKVIILTAYSDFAMAKQAIRYNVSDFVIKNDFIEELPAAIDKAVSAIREERREPEEEIQYPKLFENIIEGKSISPEEEEAFRLQDYNYCICACDIEYYDKENDNRDPGEMLNNILRIALKECEYDIIPRTERYIIVVVRYLKTGEITLNTIVDYFNNILIMVEEFMRIDIKFGLSSQKESHKLLTAGYEEARNALGRITSGGCGLRIYDAAGAQSDEENSFDIDQYTDKICEAVFDEERDDAKECLKELIDRLGESSCSFEQCQLYILVIYSMIIHKAVRYHLDADQDFGEMEKNIYGKIQEAKTIFSLMTLGNEIIDKVRSLCIGKKNFKNELVKKVDDCIRAHYQEELTLQFISNELYLNSSYISRAYKKLTGVTITEKITMYRVSKAKALLTGSNMKIYEIAQNVGFKDAAYFTNVFMRYVSQSPTEYRQQHL